MRLPLTLVAAAFGCAAAGAAQAAAVEVKDAVARVTVIPENRGDIKVEFLSTNPRLPLRVRTFAGRTIVDGDLGRRIRNCRGSGQRVRVDVRGVGEVGWRDMPQVVIRTPRTADVSTGGAVFGAVGRSAGLQLANAGCGDWTIANVEGALRLSQAGSGDSRVGSAGEARIRVAGSGDVSTAEIRGALAVEIAGAGDVSVASVAGPLKVSTAGSGDVRVHGGHAAEMQVTIAGSGDVTFDGVADSLKARIAGSGDIHVRRVRGPVSKTVMGSGGVSVGE
jgi:hypothetical protein